MRKKLKLIIGASSAFILAGSAVIFSIATYYNNKTEENLQIVETVNDDEEGENELVVDPDTLYTSLDSKALYSSLRIDKNGKPKVNDDMISRILTEVITKSHFYNEVGLKYNYKIIDDNKVLFTFHWTQDGKIYKKNYLVKIIKDLA